jgi:fructose-1-phosphate kinase PfkB-like protein
LREAARWGVACGAATASMSGTAVGSAELVERLLAEVGMTEFTGADVD